MVYKIVVSDLGFLREEIIYARFSEIKKFHEKMGKFADQSQIPEFPKRNSIMFWNHTNKDCRMIDERRRELEYYFTKLLNNEKLGGLKLLKKSMFQFQ